MARHGRHGAPRAAVRAPSAPATGPFGFSRNTKHETRITAFTLFTKHVFFDHVPCSDFPRFPGISQVPPPPAHQVPPRIAGVLDIGFMDVSPCRATVLACMSHQAAMRSPGGSQDANQAFPHRPRQTGATRSRRPAVPPASGFGVTRHETRNTRHGFFQTRITAFPEAWPLRSFDSPWVRNGRTAGNRRPDHSACRPVTACLCAVKRLWRGWSGCCGAGGAARSGMERHIAPEPVSPLRPPFTVGLTANAKGTHAEKEERSIFR